MDIALDLKTKDRRYMAEILRIRRKIQSMKTKFLQEKKVFWGEAGGGGWDFVLFVIMHVYQNVCSFLIPFFNTFENFFNTLTEKKL